MIRDCEPFDSFVEVAGMACEMARGLHAFLLHFQPSELGAVYGRLHELEHRADGKRHEVTKALERAFVTPIDRGGLIRVSQELDNVLDALEAVAAQLCIAGVRQLRPDALRFSELILRCVKGITSLMEEFKDFKKSGKISEKVIQINQWEEEGDRLYMSAMKSLHAVSRDPAEIMVWRGIYEAFENACDKCEGVADLVEAIAIENR